MQAQRKNKRIPLEQAQELADEVESKLEQSGFDKIQIVGSVRREDPDIGDLDFIVHGDMENIKSLSDEIVELGKDKATFMYDGFQVNIWYSPLETWGAALFHYTGPKGYIIGYKKRAKDQGMKLTERGLFKNNKLIAGKTEEEIYQALSKNYKEPWERGI